MMWTDTPCRITCWNCGNETIMAERSPKIEFIVAQHPWLENDCLYADVILPTNTNMEVDDIVTNTRQGTQHHSVILLHKAIEPGGRIEERLRSRPRSGQEAGQGRGVQRGQDHQGPAARGLLQHEPRQQDHLGRLREEPVRDPADRRGLGERRGRPAAVLRRSREATRCPRRPGSWSSSPPTWPSTSPATKSARPSPNGSRRAPCTTSGRGSWRAKAYPLLLMSNHGRWRVHAQADDIPWSREVVTCKVMG